MTERQKALAAYVRTLGPHISRARSMNQFIDRLMSAVREDGLFVAAQFAQGLLTQSKQRIDNQAPPAIRALTDIASNVAAEWLKSLTTKRK